MLVHLETEFGKEDENTIFVAVIATSEYVSVDAEAKERETKGRNVVDLVDENILTPHINGDDTLACNGDVAIVGKCGVLEMNAS